VFSDIVISKSRRKNAVFGKARLTAGVDLPDVSGRQSWIPANNEHIN